MTDPGSSTGTTADPPDASTSGSTAAFVDTTGTTGDGTSSSTTAAGTTSSGTTADGTSSGTTAAGETSSGTTADGTSSGTTADGTTASETTTGDDPEGTSSGGEDTDDSGGLVADGFTCCAPGCKYGLAQGHPGTARPIVSGDRLVSHVQGTKTILWNRATRRPLVVVYGASKAMLAGSLFAVVHGDVLRWYDASDGALLGALDQPASAHGLASDGSYLWLADADGLEVFALDGAALWFQAGVFDETTVNALPGRIQANPKASETVVDIDLAAAAAVVIPIDGQVGRWWTDGSGRFSAHEGAAYRLYEPDGALILAGIGSVTLGDGDLFITGQTEVRSVAQPLQIQQTIAAPDLRARNSMLYWKSNPRILVLTQNQLVETPLPPPTFSVNSFDHADGVWALAGEQGNLVDPAGQLSPGRLAYLDASRTGRLAAASMLETTHVWDIAADCGVTKTGAIAREPWPLTVADDGEVLLAADGKAIAERGVAFLSLPDGGPLGFILGGSNAMSIQAADDASLFSRRWSADQDTGDAAVLTFPGAVKWFAAPPSYRLAVAPDGAHAALIEPGQAFATQDTSYVHGAGGLVSLFDGTVYGFLDGERMIRGQYDWEEWHPGLFKKNFLGAEIVGLDGAVIQTTPLPEVPDFQRVSDTEVFVAGPPRIYDAYTGALLWSHPGAELAAAVGADFVVTSDGGELIAHKWR